MTGEDGVKIPLTIVHKDDIARDGSNPCLISGYGAYGINTDAEYESERKVLLDRGWVLAFAHVRGGGEKGKEWYRDGTKEKKLNSFLDFISCAEHLITEEMLTSKATP